MKKHNKPRQGDGLFGFLYLVKKRKMEGGVARWRPTTNGAENPIYTRRGAAEEISRACLSAHTCATIFLKDGRVPFRHPSRCLLDFTVVALFPLTFFVLLDRDSVFQLNGTNGSFARPHLRHAHPPKHMASAPKPW